MVSFDSLIGQMVVRILFDDDLYLETDVGKYKFLAQGD